MRELVFAMDPAQKQQLREAATDHPMDVLLGVLVERKLLESGEIESIPEAHAIVDLPWNQREIKAFCEEERHDFTISYGDESPQ